MSEVHLAQPSVVNRLTFKAGLFTDLSSFEMLQAWNSSTSRQPAWELTTLLLENVVLKPNWMFSECTLLLPPLTLHSWSVKRPWLCLLHTHLLARLWCGLGPVVFPFGPVRQAQCHQSWLVSSSPLKEEGRLGQLRAALSMWPCCWGWPEAQLRTWSGVSPVRVTRDRASLCWVTL